MNFLIHSLLLLTVNTATNTLLFVLDPLLSHNLTITFSLPVEKAKLTVVVVATITAPTATATAAEAETTRNPSENNNTRIIRFTCSFFLSTHINRNNLRISISILYSHPHHLRSTPPPHYITSHTYIALLLL